MSNLSNWDDLKEELLHTDPEFRRLTEEHHGCEDRLQEINQKSLLSQDDETEEKKLKLHKLALKDRMEEILRQHRSAVHYRRKIQFRDRNSLSRTTVLEAPHNED